MLKKYVYVLIPSIFIFTLVVGNRANLSVLPNAKINQLQACMDPQTSSELTEFNSSWWQAIAAECRNDPSVLDYWQTHLQQPTNRLEITRAFYPNNIKLAETATEYASHNAISHFWLGNIQKESDNPHEAISAYEAGLEISPEDGLIWRSLGDLYIDINQQHKALAAYTKACYWVDSGKNGCLLAAALHMSHQEFVLAEARYRDALRQLPMFANARLGLAKALLAQNKTEEADYLIQALVIEGYQPAIELQKTLP